MPVYSADLLLPVSSPPIKQGWIELNTDGIVINTGTSSPPEETIHLEGILVPGFVNAHCHLELSFLRNRITEKAGMSGFIKELLQLRNSTPPDQQSTGMPEACDEMLQNGIVAVGDISNNSLSAAFKIKSPIQFRTFIELFGMNPGIADSIIEEGLNLVKQFDNESLTDLTLHAPYSVSESLIDRIIDTLSKSGSPLSIHMQESMDEMQFCRNSNGPLAELFTGMGIPPSVFRHYDTAPVLYFAEKLKTIDRIMFVHNTFTTAEEIALAESMHNGITWCICPKANQFITGFLPPVHDLLNAGKRIAIGTDSLASNNSLDILSEMKVIAKNFNGVPFDTLIKWGTMNGAYSINMENEFGSLDTGRKPGLNLLQNINPESPFLSDEVTLKKVI